MISDEEIFLGNNKPAALEVVKSLFGEEVQTYVIDHGYENLIIVVDEKFVIRFPRSRKVWDRSESERYALTKLSKEANLPIPKITEIHNEPAYLYITYLTGSHLTADHIRQLPFSSQVKIGEEIANFAHTFHTCLQPEEIRGMLPVRNTTYEDNLVMYLIDRTDPNPKLDMIAKQYFQVWKERKVSTEVVVHDDLHTQNLLFNDEFFLTGVLDFGSTGIGSPEQDLRHVFRLGEIVFESACSKYEQLSRRKLERKTVKAWSITHELLAYCKESKGTSHDRGKLYLEYWFPEVKNKLS